MINKANLTPQQRAAVDDYEAGRRKEHGDSIIYEDREPFGGIIEKGAVVEHRIVSCEAIDFRLAHCCERSGEYLIRGSYKGTKKGQRWKQFGRRLCAMHAEAWCKKHGLPWPPQEDDAE